jgi:hypothetical protein
VSLDQLSCNWLDFWLPVLLILALPSSF